MYIRILSQMTFQKVLPAINLINLSHGTMTLRMCRFKCQKLSYNNFKTSHDHYIHPTVILRLSHYLSRDITSLNNQFPILKTSQYYYKKDVVSLEILHNHSRIKQLPLFKVRCI